MSDNEESKEIKFEGTDGGLLGCGCLIFLVCIFLAVLLFGIGLVRHAWHWAFG